MVGDGPHEKPSQLKFVRVAQMLLFSNALCDPPLGQTTVLKSSQDSVKFTVLLESSKSFPEQNWEAVLWHNGHDGRVWKELALQETTIPETPLAVRSDIRPHVYRRWFSVILERPLNSALVQFTLKYRLSSYDAWRWVNEHSCLTDGELLFQPETPPKDLVNYLKDFSPDFSIEPAESETPHTRLWSLTSSVKGAEGKASGFADTSLGVPRSLSRWFSLVRIWSPWLAPRHGQGQFSPHEDAVLSSFLRMDGLHLVLLAISGVDEVLTVFKPDAHGNVIAHSRNDSTELGQVRIVAAVGTTFNAALAAVIYHARKVVRGYGTMSKEVQEEMKTALEKDVKAEWMENWYDGLTYCTWNALGQDLHEQKIFDALDVLREKGIHITNLIIDDNWQSVDNHGESQFHRGWTDFEANKQGFPGGLKQTATTIREKHPNIQHIAVWHAILGYWGAVSPTGNIAKNYKTRKVRKSKGLVEGTMTVVDEQDVPRMYDDFYKFLLASGIDSVKTDAQFFLDVMDDADDRRDLIKTYQDAWTIASLRYFSIKAISCMSQIPQILFHTQLPTNKPRLMVRNSDDFFPDVPSSHPFHIFTNALTALLTSHLNVLPDWDMFQTSHPYSSFHGAARCVSGGPIYITDTPGQHSLPLIHSMTAPTIHSTTRILRPNAIGKCIEAGAYVPYESPRFLKVGTYHTGSSADYGVSILGIFNISEQSLTELVPLRDFDGVTEEGKEYIIRTHPSGEISPPMSLSSEFPVVELALHTKGWNVLTAYPLYSLPSSGERTDIAVLGLIGKMTGAAAVVGTPVFVTRDMGAVRVNVTVKALGVLGIYISTLPPSSALQDHTMVLIRNQPIPVHTVTVAKDNDKVLEIDVEAAWREMGLEAGWGNEVGVEVVVR
ncbi:MAG: hypothetical protein LQ339_000419 [Xanthoria mediterranea]|nr:MAG: hypothetical protein LQ339_000419 [Xanthoria mediterranea]